MISSTAWVPRGYAAEYPEKYELDDTEMERISAMAKLQLNDAEKDLDGDEIEGDQEQSKAENALKEDIEVDDDLKEYNLEDYDNDNDSEGEDVAMLPGLSATDAKYHEGEEGENPYLSLPTEEEQKEDRQESQIYPTDNLVLATRTEDDISFLDIYVYDDGAGNVGENDYQEDDSKINKGFMREPSLYVHHDLMLPAFPLSVEWINFRPNSPENDIGNFAAIGTFDPQIEIWNLDSIDKAFPDLILGEPEPNSMGGIKSSSKSKKSKKKKSKSQHVTTHHTDAILSLSHNKLHRNVLASTSADNTVKLWDLNTGTAARSFNHIHNNKTVSSSKWHPTEDSILLTGGYDGTCGITDVRISDTATMTKNYKVGNGLEDIETVTWGLSPEVFYCGTDSGNVYCFDVRNPEHPLWTLHAHDAGISSLDVNPNIPGLLVTSAMGEKQVKLWKYPINNDHGGSHKGPSMLLSRDFGVGNVLTSSFANDIEVAGHLTVGGVTGGLKMWDALNNRTVRNAFKSELKQTQQKAKEQAKEFGRFSRIAKKYQADESSGYADAVITVEPDSEESEHEDEDDEDEVGI